jgi:hypothetical protein
MVRDGDDFAELRIAEAKLDNDTVSFFEERLHRWGLAARCTSPTCHQFSQGLTLGPTNGLDLHQEEGLAPYRARTRFLVLTFDRSDRQ